MINNYNNIQAQQFYNLMMRNNMNYYNIFQQQNFNLQQQQQKK